MKAIGKALGCIFLVLLLMRVPAVAEERLRFVVGDQFLSRNSGPESGTRQNRIGRSVGSVSLPLPGEISHSRFSVLRSKELIVPITIGTERSSAFRAQVLEVADQDSRFGVLVVPEKTEDASGLRVYGTIFDSSGHGNPTFLSLSPSAGGSGVHEIVRVEQGEVFPPRAGLSDDLVEVPEPTLRSLVGETSRALRRSGDRTFDKNAWHEVDFVVDASGDFTGTRSAQEVASQIVSTVEAANVYYSPLRLFLRLKSVRIFDKDLSDPYYGATERRDAKEMLDTVRAQWRVLEEPEHDIVAVLARSRFGNIYGLAYPSTSCIHPNYAALFATQAGNSASSIIGLTSTIVHEMGHVIGMGHDSNGPSMMSPYFIADPDGFSDQSISEYEAYAASGGAACFTIMDNPPDLPPENDLVFENGDVQKAAVLEGQTLRYSFALKGKPSGVSFRAIGLPEGAVIDPVSGDLEYTPGFAIASSAVPVQTFPATIEAVSPYGSVSCLFELQVTNTNRVPRLVYQGANPFEVESGDGVSLGLEGYDPDAADGIEIRLLNQAAVSSFPGTPQVSLLSNTASIQWQIPSGLLGEYPFHFMVQDQSGLSSQKIISLKVGPKNLPPQLILPEKVSIQGGEEAIVVVSASDPEGNELVFDFQGLPPGALLRHATGSVEIRYLPRDAKGEQHRVSVSVSDGVKLSRSSITLTSAPLSAEELVQGGLLWPGHAGPVVMTQDYDGDGRGDVALYDASTGDWEFASCDGSPLGSRQFGGFVGDIPLAFRIEGQELPALYRNISGQGYWFVDTPQGVKSTAWGLKGDIPVSGDFDGDGISDLAVYRPQSGSWHISFSLLSSPQALYDMPLGADSSPVVYPFAVDVDGDRLDDRIIFSRKRDGSGVFYAALATGEQFSFVAAKAAPEEGLYPFVADLDADGRGDLGVHSSSGTVSVFVSGEGRVTEISGIHGEMLAALHCEKGRGAELIFSQRKNSLVLQLALKESLQSTEYKRLAGVDSATTPLSASRRRSYAVSMLRDASSLGNEEGVFAVWRRDAVNEIGRWFERASFASRGAYPSLNAEFGYPISGDFLGNGLAKLGFFAEGAWRMQDRNGSLERTVWGELGDLPVPADYNGDGILEFAVFRPSDSTWWILYMGSDAPLSAEVFPWGEAGDIPVPADYDGDGCSDIAVWRPSKGEWYVRFKDGRVKVIVFGGQDDLPLPGDYLGLGYAQPAVWRPNEGAWYLFNVQGPEQVRAYQWGLAGDKPLRGDFTGDGRQDLAVWRPGEGNWYIRSLDSLNPDIQTVQWGLPGDTPLGAFPFSN